MAQISLRRVKKEDGANEPDGVCPTADKHSDSTLDQDEFKKSEAAPTYSSTAFDWLNFVVLILEFIVHFGTQLLVTLKHRSARFEKK